MKIKNHYGALLLLALAIATDGFPQSKAPVPSGVQIGVLNINAPLFKRMEQNPVARIRVYVPPGATAHCSAVQLQLDTAARKAIARIDLLVRDDKEPAFLPGAPVLASAKPSSGLMVIPVSFTLKSGLQYIWVSAVVSTDADIDKKIKIDVSGLTLAGGGGVIKPAAPVKTSLSAAGAYKRLGIAVRKPWDDSVHTYRIPGMVCTAKGTLVAVYDVRYKNSRDLPGNIDVGMSRSTDGGRSWESMKVIMDMGAPQENNGVGDPAVLFDPVTNRIWVAALWSKGNRSIAGSMPGLSPDSSGQLVLVSSDDDGVTWSTPYNITTQVKKPAWHIYFDGPGAGIAMQNGTLVIPAQYWDAQKIPYSAIIYSEDHGKTWKSGAGAKSNTTESQVVETDKGTLMLNMRDNRGRFRSVAITTDMGKTWMEHASSYEALPDPICMASIIKARVKIKGKIRDILFFSNVASETTRENMTVKASTNMGISWPVGYHHMVDERPCYGYSVLTKIDNNTIGLLYEGEGQLYFLRIPVNDVIR